MIIGKTALLSLEEIDLKIKKLQMSCSDQDLEEIKSISQDFNNFWNLIYSEEVDSHWTAMEIASFYFPENRILEASFNESGKLCVDMVSNVPTRHIRFSYEL